MAPQQQLKYQMYRKEELAKEFRKCFPDWTEERIEEHAAFLASKFTTLRKGPNVVHFTYYGRFIDQADLKEIEQKLQQAGLDLSHFDKVNAPYQAIRNCSLDHALHLKPPIIQLILDNSGNNAVWNSLKETTLSIWHKLSSRHWNPASLTENERTYNFGLRLISDFGSNNLILPAYANEHQITAALDQVIGFLQAAENQKERPDLAKHFLFDEEKMEWLEIDLHLHDTANNCR